MENKLASVFHPRKPSGPDEAARLNAAYNAATTDVEREELLREAKIRLLQCLLYELPYDDAELSSWPSGGAEEPIGEPC